MKDLHVYALLFTIVLHTACGQSQTNIPPDIIRPETKGTVTSPGSNETYHTQYEYTDSVGRRLVIQNSFPRGELYTHPNGNEYAKAIFWTQIINETDNSLELTIDFSGDPYEFPGSVGSSAVSFYKILVPPDTMTPDAERIRNYNRTGLKSFLENNIDKPSSFKRTIHPKESSGFYVIRLLVKPKSGWQSVKEDGNIHRNPEYGTTRAGFSLKGQNLFYTLNGKEIHCGKINLKNLILKNRLLKTH